MDRSGHGSVWSNNARLRRRLGAALRDLRHADKRFHLLLRYSADMVTVTDADGTIRYASPAVPRVLGYRPVHDLTNRIHPEDQPAVAERAAYVASRPGATVTYQARLAHADGSWRHLEVVTTNLLDEACVRGIVSNARDITETLRVQERLSYEVTHDYQPVVTLPGGRITGVEALVRWQHPTEGLLGPSAFIEAAERTGLIVPLGRWVLREATRQATAWLDSYGPDAPRSISVNASARQLREPAFAGEVSAALADSGLTADRLAIEITESTAVGGGATQESLRALRAMGVRLSLDDFGTGASTLSLLASCPVDQIKLDRSFAPVPGPDAIANAVVQLARSFGMEAVAEGVETPAQAERLQSLGYARAQGYHFARPLTAEQLTASLSGRAERLVARP